MHTRVPLLLLLLTAACPEQVGQQCPPHTVAVGQYQIGFAGQLDAGGCAAKQPDGGLPATELTQANGGTPTGALCYGTADGGQQIYLVIPGKGARASALAADGGFHFTGHSDPVLGTACGCLVSIDEVFDGFLQTTPDAGFALQPDGGLPEISSLTGSLVDTLATPSGTTGCLCNLPCPVTYAITGTRK